MIQEIPKKPHLYSNPKPPQSITHKSSLHRATYNFNKYPKFTTIQSHPNNKKSSLESGTHKFKKYPIKNPTFTATDNSKKTKKRINLYNNPNPQKL